MNPYQELLDRSFPPDRFVQLGLRLLEADFRDQALRSLADWEQSGLGVREDADVHASLFAAIAALQRPSWGNWNGLVMALRKARSVVRKANDPDRLERLAKATLLNQVIEWVDTPLVPDEVTALGLLRDLVQPGRRGKLNVGQAIGPAPARPGRRPGARLPPAARPAGTSRVEGGDAR